MKQKFFALFILLLLHSIAFASPVKIGTFLQEISQYYGTDDGLPSANVLAVYVTNDGTVYAGTDNGLVFRKQGKWLPINGTAGKKIVALAGHGNRVVALVKESAGKSATIRLSIYQHGGLVKSFIVPEEFKLIPGPGIVAANAKDMVFLATHDDILQIPVNKKNFQARSLHAPEGPIFQITVNGNGTLWLAGNQGLYQYQPSRRRWRQMYPRAGTRSWAPERVHGAVYDNLGALWFASPQGVGRYDGNWTLFTGQDGLPYNDFTIAAAGGDGAVWFGTHKGAIRYDGVDWEYRQGRRWLPDDDVRDIAVDSRGNAWFATARGVGLIQRLPMTLARKAKKYERAIDKYHRRTPYEYVLEVTLPTPGDTTRWIRHDSDNDGLWTSMYGAGECFAYAATKDAKAKARAKKAFEALHFLGKVTQGGSHPAPPGFVARTILPTSGPDPNKGRVERDRWEKAHEDTLWKIIVPRWPVSADGKWYWKTDTSSDELDGHYFFYARYYDLVAETEAEKTRVREHVRRLTDHLIKHHFMLVDHDGKPTRWARFNPYELNHDLNWAFDRGINSLSMLSYLFTTAHITGDEKYIKVAEELIEKHGYLQNMMNPKTQRGAGTGNQSDDEMAFMCFYNLIKYDPDPQRRAREALAFWAYWRLEQPEMNPFFNFAFAATCTGMTVTDAWGTYPLDPTGDWLEDAIETLKRFPLDRINWRHENSHRLDIIHLEDWMRGFDEGGVENRGKRVNGKVIPVDECYFNHWNRDPWELNTGGNGGEMGDGAVFLLPYYMGLYHGFIED